MRQNPKSEIRNPKEGRSAKSETVSVPYSQGNLAPNSLLRLSSPFGLRISAFGLLLLACSSTAFSAGNLISTNDIPPLRPIRPDLPPTFWEQYGSWVVAGAAALVLLIAAAGWLLTRPKPTIPLPPGVQARRALEPLRGQAEDGALLSRVSQILRHYVTAAFSLPAGELTTAEFCRFLITVERMGPSISVPLTDFLRQCDLRKFAPDPPASPPLRAAEQALSFVDQCETRLAELRQPAVPGASVGSGNKTGPGSQPSGPAPA